jgi:6-phosphogluconolactonase
MKEAGMKSDPPFHSYHDKSALHEALEARVAGELRKAIETRGSATLAVSGGSTPKPLFERLAHAELPWEKVTVTLVDERWVDPASEASNEHLVRSLLLQDNAAKAAFVGLKTGDATPEAGTAECEARLKNLPSVPDVVLLGMGNDGHTASLFPRAPELKNLLKGDALCGALRPSHAPHPRMTMSLPMLLQSRLLLLHIEGEEKYAVYRNALADSDIAEMPVRALLLQEETPLEVYYA